MPKEFHETTSVQKRFLYEMAGEEGFEPSHVGIKIRCLNQLGDSPTPGPGPMPRTHKQAKRIHAQKTSRKSCCATVCK
jgi:hypothetical protein